MLTIPCSLRAELWKCSNGTYLSHPSPELKCEKVETSTRCNRDGTRVISGAGATSDECFKAKPDPFIRTGVIGPATSVSTETENSASIPARRLQPRRSLAKPSFSTTDMNPSIEGLSDEEIARRSVHNPAYMQKWASRVENSDVSAFRGMGSALDMQRDLNAFKRGDVPDGYK